VLRTQRGNHTGRTHSWGSPIWLPEVGTRARKQALLVLLSSFLASDTQHLWLRCCSWFSWPQPSLFWMGEQRYTECWGSCPELERSCGLYQKAGVIYSGRKAQEHGTGRTNFTPPQCLVMMRTQIFLWASQGEISCFSELTQELWDQRPCLPGPL